jgi:hypothetical protein
MLQKAATEVSTPKFTEVPHSHPARQPRRAFDHIAVEP